jgi:hypothetical protein
MTAARLVEEMPAEEFDEWLLLYSARPWGFDIDNLRMGTLAATVHNSSGYAKRAASARDYFPRFRRPGAVKDPDYWREAQEACRAFVERQRKRHGQ